MNESISIPTPDHSTLEFELAGLGSRFAAYLIDSIFIVALILGVGLGLVLMGAITADSFKDTIGRGGPGAASWAVAFLVLFAYTIVWGYYVFFESVMRGSTPGKKAIGIRTLRDDALPIGFRESALRNLVRAADSFPPPTYILGGVAMLLDPWGRRLGDLVAGTIVVREKFDQALASAIGTRWAARVERGQSGHGMILPGGTVNSKQLELIEQFMSRRHQLQPDRRDAIVWQITAPLLPLRDEDPASWQARPDRTAACEGFLRELLEMARQPNANRQAARTRSPGGELF